MTQRSDLSADERRVVERFEAAGQGQVFRFLHELRAHEARALVQQAAGVDLDLVRDLASGAKAPATEGVIEPLGAELIRIREGDDSRRERDAAHERGVAELRGGRVAVVVAAGGQGTRLGSTTPKGLWPVGPASAKPLLRWQAEKVLFWAKETGRPIPFLVMVSDATASRVEGFLRWHGFFGLDPTWVRTFRQRSVPALDDEGRLLLDAPSRIAVAPNGHGGVYAALRDAHLLDLLADHGVTTISYVQVDNPLVRTVDPVFVGFHVQRANQISSKSVVKRGPDEKVGVFARVGGKLTVVEYTELTREQACAVDEGGSLAFGQGSIAAHCIDVQFARRVAGVDLPWHRARKRVPYVDHSGSRVTPQVPNATKFETFLFDAIPLAERSIVVETLRGDEFSPLKNADGEDSPDTVREDLQALFRRWYERAGVPVPRGALEVDPSKAPDEHAFRRLHGVVQGVK